MSDLYEIETHDVRTEIQYVDGIARIPVTTRSFSSIACGPISTSNEDTYLISGGNRESNEKVNAKANNRVSITPSLQSECSDAFVLPDTSYSMSLGNRRQSVSQQHTFREASLKEINVSISDGEYSDNDQHSQTQSNNDIHCSDDNDNSQSQHDIDEPNNEHVIEINQNINERNQEITQKRDMNQDQEVDAAELDRHITIHHRSRYMFNGCFTLLISIPLICLILSILAYTTIPDITDDQREIAKCIALVLLGVHIPGPILSLLLWRKF